MKRLNLLFLPLVFLLSVSSYGSPITADLISAPTGLTVQSGNSNVTFGTVSDNSQVMTTGGSQTVSNKNFDGSSNVLHEASFYYNFDTQTGASGTTVNMGMNIPSNSVIVRVWIDQIESLGNGTGTATISFGASSAVDLLAATTATALTTGQALGVPQSTTNTAIKLLNNGPFNGTMNVRSGSIVSGAVKIFVDYFASVNSRNNP